MVQRAPKLFRLPERAFGESIVFPARARDFFPKLLVRHRERDCLRDRRVIGQDFINLARRDLFAPAVDDFL